MHEGLGAGAQKQPAERAGHDIVEGDGLVNLNVATARHFQKDRYGHTAGDTENQRVHSRVREETALILESSPCGGKSSGQEKRCAAAPKDSNFGEKSSTSPKSCMLWTGTTGVRCVCKCNLECRDGKPDRGSELPWLPVVAIHDLHLR